MKSLLKITFFISLILPLSACDSLHQKSDPEALRKLCIREAELNYQNRGVSRNAEKLFNKAIEACDVKFQACMHNNRSKKCKNFSLKYMVEYSQMR